MNAPRGRDWTGAWALRYPSGVKSLAARLGLLGAACLLATACQQRGQKRPPAPQSSPATFDATRHGRAEPRHPPRAPETRQVASARRATRFHALRPRRYNVLWVAIDTLRADRMGWAGYRRHLTPHLDRLAAQSVVFDRAYSPSNRTSLTFPALFTGRYTSELHRGHGYFVRLKPDNTFLAGLFRDAGYKTIGSASHFAFDPYYGLSHGFEVWQLYADRDRKVMNRMVTADVVTKRAMALLAPFTPVGSPKQTRPFYLFLHYLDPHLRYVRHRRKPRFGTSRTDRYDGEIFYVDQHIGQLLSFMRQKHLLEDTVIVVTSDHGECLGEHGNISHGHTLNECELRVPLLLHVPGLGHRRIRRAVSTLDLPRTLLALVGLRAPAALQGLSWLPWLRTGLPLPPRLVYSEVVRGPYGRMSRALIQYPFKLVQWPLKGQTLLYRLDQDPGETRDLSKRRPAVAQTMREALRAFRKSALHERRAVKFR